MEEVSEEVCEKCGKPMIVKWGRYGQFLGCSGYPECKNIKSYHKDETPPEDESKSGTSATHEICDKCGKPMVIKTSRAGGKFLACTGYPECKNAKPINTGVNCPEPGCDGYIGERRSKRGRIFYSCSRYPDCKFALWDKPVSKSCPECGASFLVEKTSKAKGQHLACVNKKCGYTE
jgi:DNA topoisomerase-1